MASNKPTAVHFSLIIFVMLSIIMSVVAYLYIDTDIKNREKYAKRQQEVDAAKRESNRLGQEVAALKQVIGHQYDSVGLDARDDANTVLGAMLQDMKKFGGALAQGTYAATIAKLRQELDTVTADRNKKQADLNDVKARMLALQNQYNAKVQVAEAAAATAEKGKTAAQQTKEESLIAKDRQIASLRTAVTKAQQDLEAERESHEATRKKLLRENTKLTQINTRLREELNNALATSFEVPDGKITWVDHVSKLVWINLGEAGKLTKRMTFSVYRNKHSGVGRGQQYIKDDIKANIEITRVLGPHRAEARITSEDLYKPIAAGDPIYTPLWSPGQTEGFAFIGGIDFDGDGKSDRARLHEILKSIGARIDAEVDDTGKRTGRKIDERTKFFVVGSIPDPTKVGPNEKDAAKKIQTQLKSMNTEARLHAVRKITLNDFLAFIGYRSKRRLWRPGEEFPYTLKSGSHSTGVNETLGSRAAAGRTSGLYSGNRQLKSTPSSGQTSKVFGGSKRGY